MSAGLVVMVMVLVFLLLLTMVKLTIGYLSFAGQLIQHVSKAFFDREKGFKAILPLNVLLSHELANLPGLLLVGIVVSCLDLDPTL